MCHTHGLPHSPKYIPIEIRIPSWIPNLGWNSKLIHRENAQHWQLPQIYWSRSIEKHLFVCVFVWKQWAYADYPTDVVNQLLALKGLCKIYLQPSRHGPDFLPRRSQNCLLGVKHVQGPWGYPRCFYLVYTQSQKKFILIQNRVMVMRPESLHDTLKTIWQNRHDPGSRSESQRHQEKWTD